MTPSRPILRYHGGKWMLARWIIAHLPRHRVYVEPFGGAASVLLQKPRSYAEVYNDLDGEVVNLFRVVRDYSRRLTRELIWTPFSRDEYRVALGPPSDDPVENARRLIVRCFMGYGSNANNRAVKSGFRANAHRQGTTPAHDWESFPPNIRRVADRFRGVVIENKPAAEIIEQQDSRSTLFYCDPPYVHSTRAMGNGHDGYFHEMTDDDHRELAKQLHQVRGMVVLSGYPGDLYDELYAGWPTVQRDAHGDGGCDRTEVLWLNPAADAALHHNTLFAPAVDPYDPHRGRPGTPGSRRILGLMPGAGRGRNA